MSFETQPVNIRDFCVHDEGRAIQPAPRTGNPIKPEPAIKLEVDLERAIQSADSIDLEPTIKLELGDEHTTGCEDLPNTPPGRKANLAPNSRVHASACSVVVGCKFDLATRKWEKVPNSGLPSDFDVTKLPVGPFRSILFTKGRHSRDERESERRAQEILRDSAWRIEPTTNVEDLECLLSALVRWLEGTLAIGQGAPDLAWCVGGSLDATLRGRSHDGYSNVLQFVLCDRSDWTGDSKTTKCGNTCRWHAGGLTLYDVVIGGKLRNRVILRRCMWMKCCYGRKHYGDPLNDIPWCATCEYQKKVTRKKSSSAATARGRYRGCRTGPAPARAPIEPCYNCLQRLVTPESNSRFRSCHPSRGHIQYNRRFPPQWTEHTRILHDCQTLCDADSCAVLLCVRA